MTDLGRYALVGLMVALGSCGQPVEPEPVPEPTPAAADVRIHDGSFDSNGIEIHYTDNGEGEPVVLVHGLLSSGEMWQGVAPVLLDAGYRVLTIDARGHGESGKPTDPAQYGVEMVHDVGRFLNHVGLDRVHLVGYSMGGLITNRFRAEHPERLISATMLGFGWMNDESPLADTEGVAARIAERDIAPLLAALTPGDPPEPSEEQRAGTNAAVFSTNDPAAIAAVYRSFPEIDTHTADSLASNQVPTLAVVGEEDALKRDVAAMAEVMSNVRVVELPGANHGSSPTAPLFTESLLAFLNEHRAAS